MDFRGSTFGEYGRHLSRSFQGVNRTTQQFFSSPRRFDFRAYSQPLTMRFSSAGDITQRGFDKIFGYVPSSFFFINTYNSSKPASYDIASYEQGLHVRVHATRQAATVLSPEEQGSQTDIAHDKADQNLSIMIEGKKRDTSIWKYLHKISKLAGIKYKEIKFFFGGEDTTQLWPTVVTREFRKLDIVKQNVPKKHLYPGIDESLLDNDDIFLDSLVGQRLVYIRPDLEQFQPNGVLPKPLFTGNVLFDEMGLNYSEIARALGKKKLRDALYQAGRNAYKIECEEERLLAIKEGRVDPKTDEAYSVESFNFPILRNSRLSVRNLARFNPPTAENPEPIENKPEVYEGEVFLQLASPQLVSEYESKSDHYRDEHYLCLYGQPDHPVFENLRNFIAFRNSMAIALKKFAEAYQLRPPLWTFTRVKNEIVQALKKRQARKKNIPKDPDEYFKVWVMGKLPLDVEFDLSIPNTRLLFDPKGFVDKTSAMSLICQDAKTEISDAMIVLPPLSDDRKEIIRAGFQSSTASKNCKADSGDIGKPLIRIVNKHNRADYEAVVRMSNDGYDDNDFYPTNLNIRSSKLRYERTSREHYLIINDDSDEMPWKDIQAASKIIIEEFQKRPRSRPRPVDLDQRNYFISDPTKGKKPSRITFMGSAHGTNKQLCRDIEFLAAAIQENKISTTWFGGNKEIMKGFVDKIIDKFLLFGISTKSLLSSEAKDSKPPECREFLTVDKIGVRGYALHAMGLLHIYGPFGIGGRDELYQKLMLHIDLEQPGNPTSTESDYDKFSKRPGLFYAPDYIPHSQMILRASMGDDWYERALINNPASPFEDMPPFFIAKTIEELVAKMLELDKWHPREPEQAITMDGKFSYNALPIPEYRLGYLPMAHPLRFGEINITHGSNFIEAAL